ncbi:related to Trimethyllysine dioxygenase [Armillaria ostoyae]|uniref:trimethyllysine dioxygenase n=1 Tax=Armillaria ostoyae TaxID=47428 RepID=A0A284QU22_ARMOS|nr:related to Trimethyllysine dioxygenase [Armillaria ostoyae]
MWSARVANLAKQPLRLESRSLARCLSHSKKLPARRWTALRTAASAAVLRSKPPAFVEELQPLPNVSTDDLPITSMDDRKVAIGWDTRTWSRFHHIWLRDHCRCERCFHAVTKQRLVNTFDIPTDIRPLSVESKPDGLQVTWPAHVSLYPWSWLQENSYDPPLRKTEPLSGKILWGAKIQQSPPTVTYEEVMANDELGLFRWLSNVDKFGFSFVSDVPQTTEATEKLSERIGFIRETQYGKFWDFTSDLARGDTAYTTLALGAHTDNIYFTDPCGLQLFHLLSHTDGTGGATLLVDGFYVASILKELHPEAYSLLARVPVPAHAAGEAEILYHASRPVLSHDPATGELSQVRWNNDDRSVMNHLDPLVVDQWYDAIRKWNQNLTSPDSEYWVQLTPGTAVVVNNHRVLHGRSTFDGKRRMCGAYIGIDEYNSKFAVLKDKFCPDTRPDVDTTSKDSVRSVWNPLL